MVDLGSLHRKPGRSLEDVSGTVDDGAEGRHEEQRQGDAQVS